ncbi:DedA family protein [Pradoshia sp.]|uniref:DedA family protein n=1 Tax=Pradoshia sp. TaxID=2651281 RepID=UPI003F100B00
MENWIIDIMDQFGYIGILFLIAVENIFPPIPSEVILTFGGAMTAETSMTVTGVVAVSTAGSIIGAVILYGLGMLLGKERIEKIVKRYGHILRVTVEDVEKADNWFHKYGLWTIFFCRFVPLIRSLISIPAGMARINFVTFLLLTTIGTFIWNVVLVSIGAMLGDSWESIVHYMDYYSNVVYVLLVILFLAFVIWYVRKKFIKVEK